MVLQALSPPQQPSQSTQPISTLSLLEITPSDPALGPTREKDVCGWLVNRSTHEVCLTIRRGKVSIIGRDPTSDLVLDESTISNRHCLFRVMTSGAVLCEDTSFNGTYWNGTLIGKRESVVLSNEDSIYIKCGHSFIFLAPTTWRWMHRDPEIENVTKTYQILPRTLARGTFGRVKVAIHRKSKIQLAVKIVKRNQDVLRSTGGTDVHKEVAILQTIRHPNIVPMVDVIKTKRSVYIFMQLLTGGDLFEYTARVGALPEPQAKFIGYQVMTALQYLHKQNISHRDLKPENLLLTSMADYPRVLLGDFGMARKCPQGSSMNTMCGTLAYMAPEVLDAKYDQSPGYDHSADCWSLGVTLYRILSDAHPFTSNGGTSDEATIRNDLRNKVLEFPQCDWGRISIEARALIRHLLVHDPEQRWSVEDALNSEWIRMDEVWLEHRYRESVLLHWIKSSLHLNVVAKRAAPDPLEDDSLRKRARTEQTDSHSESEDTNIYTRDMGASSTSTMHVPDISDDGAEGYFPEDSSCH